MADHSTRAHIINFNPGDVEELETADRIGGVGTMLENITGLSALVLSICCQVPCGRVINIFHIQTRMKRLHVSGILKESLDDILKSGGFVPEQLTKVAYHMGFNLGIWDRGSALAYSEVQDISLPTVLVKYQGVGLWTGLRRKDGEEASTLDVCPTASILPHPPEYNRILRLIDRLEIPDGLTELVPYWREDFRRRWYRPIDQFARLWDRWISTLPEDQRPPHVNQRATDWDQQSVRIDAFYYIQLADYNASMAVTKPFSRFGAITAEQQAELRVKKRPPILRDTQGFPAAQRRCIHRWLRLLTNKNGWEGKSYLKDRVYILSKDGVRRYLIKMSDEFCEWRRFQQASNPSTIYRFKNPARDLGPADEESEVIQMWDVLPGFFDGAHDGAMETLVLYTIRSAIELDCYPDTEVLLSSASPWALDINISMKAFGDRMKYDLFVDRIE